MAGSDGEVAMKWAPQRTIPDSRKTESVSTTAMVDLGSVIADDGPDTSNAQDLGGRWVFLVATGADVTVQRGNAPGTAGSGLVIVADGKAEEFWVDPKGSKDLHALSGSAASLHILWDSEQVRS